MPHIPVPDDLPGIVGLLAFKPSTGGRVTQLTQELLRGSSPLSPAERETIAAHVSRLNECEFCARSHAATIPHLDHGALDHGAAPEQPARAQADPAQPGLRLAALLGLAEAVVRGGHHVTDELVAAARAAGAGDEEIHDTVLIAAAFCMFNRYVDGLGAVTPTDEAAYDAMGIQLALHGYVGAAPGSDTP